ncbi:MAG TPA: hypothetical protein VGJ00_08405 [Rhabdochlamydiaceae bacterium]|jgi:hypothetical protein
MFVAPVSVEYSSPVLVQDDVKLLQEQFGMFYAKACECFPNSCVETQRGMTSYLSGIPLHNFNAIMGYPKEQQDDCIKERLAFFDAAQMPFIWYVNEDVDPAFVQKLKEHDFVDWGVFRGVFGPLDPSLASSPLPDGFVMERVTDSAAFEEFNAVVCSVFGLESSTKEMYKEFLGRMMHDDPPMFHWVVRKEGKVVSCVSTYIVDNVISFWNGATLPELRKQGLNMALRRFVLQDGILRGAKFGSSYLMSEGLAYGICSKLGYQTRWRFNAFLSPSTNGVNNDKAQTSITAQP